MENYGFTAGFSSRIFKKFMPEIPAEDTFEFYLKSELGDDSIVDVLHALDEFLSHEMIKASITNDLNNSILALCSKVISFGLDHKFKAIFENLHIDSSCYNNLLYHTSSLSKGVNVPNLAFYKSLDGIEKTIKSIPENNAIIGTSLHLTVTIKNLLNYIKRIRVLLDLRSDIRSEKKWEYLLKDYIIHTTSKYSLRKFFTSHTDLLAFEVVEHTAQKGEKYVADTKKEYVNFFKKGLLGGVLISIFALFKIVIDTLSLSELPLAFWYSINYALCFVIVYYLGGTIATKQPAMTASTIAKNIDKDGDWQFGALKDTILLLRKISRSQFISLLGNFIMAFLGSCLIAFILTLVVGLDPIDVHKSEYLIKQVFPFSGGGIYFAAIAGIFLSVSGFISGYFDNKVKAINLTYRIQHNTFLLRYFSETSLKKSSLLIEKSLGVYLGNISLGFFLGSAFLFSYILPFNIDIRHIAFSSANVGYAIVNNSFAVTTIILALVSVLIIGFVNFIVSFSMTFFLVLKSRSIKFRSLKQLFRLTLKDFFRNPLDYFLIRNKKMIK